MPRPGEFWIWDLIRISGFGFTLSARLRIRGWESYGNVRTASSVES